MTLTITHQGSSSATGIAGGLPTIGSKGLGSAVGGGFDASNIFGSLLATLFSLTGVEEAKSLTPQLTSENLTALSDTLLKLQQTLENGDPVQTTGAHQAEPEANPLELIANLIETLKQLSETTERGAALNPGAIERAANAIDTITRLLDAAAQKPAPATQPVPSTTPQTAIDTTLQRASTPGSAERAKAPIPPAIVDQLTRLANKLSNAAPELGSKLEQLAAKLQQVTPPTISQTALTDDADLNQLLQSLIGEKQVTGPKSNLPVEGEKIVLRGLDSAPQKSATPIEAPRLDINASKALAANVKQATADPTAKPDAATTNLAGVATSAATAAGRTERAQPTDPFLLAQTSTQGLARTDSASAVKPVTSTYQAQTQTPNLPNIAFEIARQHSAGLSRFQIRMDPPEMGKIDVRLNVDNAGNLHARLTVERTETLDLLQRDARTLEKALQQAGLESRSTNLEFSLRQNPFARQDGQFANNQNDPGQVFSLNDEADTPIVDLPRPNFYRGIASPGGVNMFA